MLWCPLVCFQFSVCALSIACKAIATATACIVVFGSRFTNKAQLNQWDSFSCENLDLKDKDVMNPCWRLNHRMCKFWSSDIFTISHKPERTDVHRETVMKQAGWQEGQGWGRRIRESGPHFLYLLQIFSLWNSPLDYSSSQEALEKGLLPLWLIW